MSPKIRTYIYNIVLALLPILTFYGLITDTIAPLLLALASAILGMGTAVAYRPTKNKKTNDSKGE